MISRHSFARAGLLGNPSDGYGGKAISLTFDQFRATVELRPERELTICPGPGDVDRYASLEEFDRQIDHRGLYGGVRLIKATLKRFCDYCRDRTQLHAENFSIRYETNIPRGVGLAGSSAIVTATLKALVEFYQFKIPPKTLASLALSVERDVLGIPAGLQDRVIQMLEGVVYMDFSANVMSGEAGLESGQYESLSLKSPAPLFIAWCDSASQPTEVFHNDLQSRFRAGDKTVVHAMQQFAAFAESGRRAWIDGDGPALTRLINANFDLRRTICQLPASQLQMVEQARNAGASAKFCGSGGAIIGSVDEAACLPVVQQRMTQIGCRFVQPQIV